MVTPIFNLLYAIIQLYIIVLLVSCVFSFLYSFGVLNSSSRFVWSIGEFLTRVTEPVLRPVRRILPQFGNIDLSPLIVLLVLQYLAVPLLRTVEIAILTQSAPQFFS